MVKFYTLRRTSHLAVRQTARRTARVPFRCRWRAPDDLGKALTCFRRALRAHKRLAKLAPAFFDSAVIAREARRRKAQRDWMASWEPAFREAYGSTTTPWKPRDELPPLPPPRTRKAVDRELTSCQLWLHLGHNSLARYKRRRPYRLVSFNQIVRMVEVAFDLRRMAVGLDSEINSEIEDDNIPDYHQFEADLQRVYGNSLEKAASNPEPVPEVASTLPATHIKPAQAQPAAPSHAHGPQPGLAPAHAAPQPTSGPVIEYRRRDAWASYARYLRNIKR